MTDNSQTIKYVLGAAALITSAFLYVNMKPSDQEVSEVSQEIEEESKAAEKSDEMTVMTNVKVVKEMNECYKNCGDTYTIESGDLSVTVCSYGASILSVLYKGKEMTL
jgi:hypothetical protein